MIRYTLRHRVRFIKYAAFGAGAFALDLGMLYFLISADWLAYVYAVPVSFFIATSLHYAGLKLFAYHDSTREVHTGYAYFIIIMSVSMLLVTGLVIGLVEYVGAPLFPARIAVGTLVGFISFFLNSRYNFKVL